MEEFHQLLNGERKAATKTCENMYNVAMAILHAEDKTDMENAAIAPNQVFQYLGKLGNIYNSRSGLQTVHLVQDLLKLKVNGETPQDIKRFGISYAQRVKEIEDLSGEKLQHVLQVSGYLQAFPSKLQYIVEHLKLNADLKDGNLDHIMTLAERLAVHHNMSTRHQNGTDTESPNVALAAQENSRSQGQR